MVSIVLSTNPKHSLILATMKKINSTSAKTRRVCYSLQIVSPEKTLIVGRKHVKVIVNIEIRGKF